MKAPENADFFMSEALRLAQMGYGTTSPNPMVGAVVVKDGQIVGRGFHQYAGTAHAEVNALMDAGSAACGADLYVTLEPCSTYGRTPPCTEAIIRSRIKRVLVGSLDDNSDHCGRGLQILRDAGVEVIDGIMTQECRKINEPFFYWITQRKPWVILKMAMTLDGKIATVGGESKWITSPEARARVQELRRLSDAIMVSGETLRQDRPSLTVREPSNWFKQPLKIIFSQHLSEADVRTYFPPEAEVLVVNLKDRKSWDEFLLELGRRNIMVLLIEGGGELAGQAIAHQAVNELEFHIAPKILTGRDSRVVVGGDNPAHLSEAFDLKAMNVRQIGRDLIVNGRLK